MSKKFEKDINKEAKKTTGAFDSFKNVLESSVKDGFNKFTHAAEDTVHKAEHTASCAKENVEDASKQGKNLLENLTENINNTFKHNLTLGQTCLQCKTATDFADIQRKFFECNFKNMMKTYSDLMQDMQQMTSKAMKNSAMPMGRN